MKKTYQPRYAQYCRSQGRPPEAQLAHDREAWPGGRMCGYILWVNEHWTEWSNIVGWNRAEDGAYSEAHHTAFSKWLEDKVNKEIPGDEEESPSQASPAAAQPSASS